MRILFAAAGTWFALIGACLNSTHAQAIQPAAKQSVNFDNDPDSTKSADAIASQLAAAKPKQTTWLTLPEIHFQISTPRDYLSDRRDDFSASQQTAEYAEYGIALLADEKNNLRVRTVTTTDVGAKPVYEDSGVQLVASHSVHWHQNAASFFRLDADLGELDFSYGLRYQQFYEWFYWSAQGGLLNFIEFETNANNNLQGPQVALSWSKQKFGCLFNVDSKLMRGHNFLDANQVGSIGHTFWGGPLLYAGGVNRPVISQPTRVTHGLSMEEDVTVAEVGASLSYPLSRGLIFQLGYSGIYFSDLHDAWNLQRWSLPDLGLDSSRSYDLWRDRVYASVEWRR